MAKMYARDHIPRKTVVRMDPDCAICHAPASMACDCEAKGLEVAIKQAEHRMMQSIYNEIRFVLDLSPSPSLTFLPEMLTRRAWIGFLLSRAGLGLEHMRKTTSLNISAFSPSVERLPTWHTWTAYPPMLITITSPHRIPTTLPLRRPP